MHHEIRIDAAQHRATIKTRGKASVEGVRASTEEMVAHAEWSPGMNVLVDFRELDGAHLRRDDIRSMSDVAKRLKEQLGDGCCAVVTGQMVAFGLARMWQMMTEDHIEQRIRVFQSLDEAEAWLGRKRRPSRV